MKLRAKIIAAALGGIAVLAIVNYLVFARGVDELREQSKTEVGEGLIVSYKRSLDAHMREASKTAADHLDDVERELRISAHLAQDMLRGAGPFKDYTGPGGIALGPDALPEVSYDAKLRAIQAPPDPSIAEAQSKETLVLTAWRQAFVGAGELRPEVAQDIRRTRMLELFLPAIVLDGTAKLQQFYFGPPERPFIRSFPYVDLRERMAKHYPGHDEQDIWTFFFPGMVDSWRASWTAGHRPRVLYTHPYKDAATGEAVFSLFHPLWSVKGEFLGALGVDLALSSVIADIGALSYSREGFAFLVDPGGKVLAIPGPGQELLGLRGRGHELGNLVSIERKLGDSEQPEVRALAKTIENIGLRDGASEEIEIAGQGYLLSLTPMPDRLVYQEDGSFRKEHWTLAYLVPLSEVLEQLDVAGRQIDELAKEQTRAQLSVAVAAFGLVLLLLVTATATMTRSLAQLVNSAESIADKNYDVEIAVGAEDSDEVSRVARAFNVMAREIKLYTDSLEDKVSERTGELEQANARITELNSRLEAENLQLNAELDITRRLQQMVLPSQAELEAVDQLDIAGYMEPATEVGGDYYDVLQSGGRLKVGIGDVTGHGLESGVVMLMVQTAVRTMLAAGERDPVRSYSVVNQVMYDNLQRTKVDRILTLLLLDYHAGVIQLTGQHEEAIVVRRDGSIERIDTMDLGVPIGIEQDVTQFVRTTTIELEPDDLVALYTDGVIEAPDDNDLQYGLERLCGVLCGVRERGAAEIRQRVLDDLAEHMGTTPVADDITLLVLKQR